MALSGNLEAQRRRDELVELANGPQGVMIDAAAELFSVSSMTIRRDLLELEAEGRVRRVRGGATAAPRARPFDARRAIRAGAKRTIAEKALRLVPPSGTIALDASTTISMLASTIGPRAGLTAYTNSLESFQLLHPLDGVTAVISGGTAEPTTGSLVGPIARRSMRAVYFDVFFSSADALDGEDGTSEVSLEEAELKQAMAASAAKTVVCVDSSKLQRRSVARALERDDISTLVTELDPEDERLAAYRGVFDLL
ncbi:DeoR/GlpR family transcriptional regulator of sugar metabolism [Microbacterium resistens]|uniref:DeoR/GlpR family transcriptional regulator of sugar metabolism n=1 Tax=Microbacterium resistens TaxID=156977 RepID=A0ABU1SCY8_9MICO|nr:DeoR/GlpR family DNA-binding transcription regulator [Microbacterium resistens]MDR6867465.1 DeoR/GlpR family transcriptional regulator of sugar metabolism [Microbacterium resistens]